MNATTARAGSIAQLPAGGMRAGRRGAGEQCGGHHGVLPARRPAGPAASRTSVAGKMGTTTVLTGQLAWCWHHRHEPKEARAAALAARRRPHPAHRPPRRRRPVGPALGEPGDAGWFGPGSTIWSVHADAATLVGGVRALLVQAMHPTVLAGFDQHSDYQEDPESRLQRTAAFVTVTTFGTTAQAEAACDRVRRAHAPVRGRTPDGDPYDAGDPELLGWVHLALADSLAVAVAAVRPHPVRPRRLPRRHGGRGRAARVGARAARPGRAGRRVGPLPAAARRHRRHRRGARLPARPAAAAADPAALPGDRRGRGRLPAAGAAPAARRPAGAARRCPRRLVGRAATRLLAAVLGESPAARAAHRRTRPVGTVRG